MFDISCFKIKKIHLNILFTGVHGFCHDGLSAFYHLIQARILNGSEFGSNKSNSSIKTMAQSRLGLGWLGPQELVFFASLQKEVETLNCCGRSPCSDLYA